jgi:hypothetical protein
MNTDLQLFVKEGLEKGLSRERMSKALSAAGWQEDEVKTALDTYADVDFPVAVPKRKPYLSAREAFMYLVMFLTLYIASISLGTIMFQFVNRWFPDALEYSYIYETTTSIIRSATAALIITFPVFFWMSRTLRQAIAKDPEKRSSKVRKWLTYVTLFVAAGVIIADLITLVTYFLSGEISVRFLLKVFIVLLIAGSIFGYYLWDLRGEEKETPRTWKAYPAGLKAFVGAVVAIVTITAVGGLWTAGSPSAERAHRFDDRRISDLQSISYAIDNYWGINKSLPKDLETLSKTRDVYVGSIVDPETSTPYEYTLTDSDSYTLCAEFATATPANEDPRINTVNSRYWEHSEGHACFNIDVRKPSDLPTVQ